MNYKLFAASLVPQLSRVFANVNADDKSCYLVKLNAGYTERDLNKCLNFQAATGAGYVFDAALAASSGICAVLAKGTNCTRQIDRQKIAVSDCSLTAIAEGVPTHLVLGGILPISLTVGQDVTLLYPDLTIKYDPNGYKTQIIINAFNIPLTNIWSELVTAPWYTGQEAIAFDSNAFNTGNFTDYVGLNIAVTGGVKLATDGSGIDLSTNGNLTIASVPQLDLSKSFTLEMDFHQSGLADYAECQLIGLGTTSSDRFSICFDRSNERGLCLWNNSGGGSVAAKVSRPIGPYSGLISNVPVPLKYVYDASTGRHTVSVNGAVVDTFVYQILKPAASAQQILIRGGYGVGANAAYTPIIDKYRIRQGV